MKFNVAFASVDIFKKIINSIVELCDDVQFKFTPNEGMSVQAMDSAHVAMGFLSIHYTEFPKFECDQESRIGLKCSNLLKVLSICKKGDEISMIRTKENEVKIAIRGNDVKENRNVNVDMILMDLDVEEMEIPPMEFDIFGKISSSFFSENVKSVTQFSDVVTFSYTKGKFVMSSKESTFGEIAMDFSFFKNLNDNYDDSNDLSINFSSRYLRMFTRACCLSDNLYIKISDQTPICVDFSISKKSYLKFYLAPKIED